MTTLPDNIKRKKSVTLAFAGKRILPVPASDIELALKECFNWMNEQLPETSITLLTGLAAGADQIAAKAFFHTSWTNYADLHIVIPGHYDDYVKTIEEHEARILFEKWWSLNSKKTSLTGIGNSNEPNEVYRLQSDFLLKHGDLLLASTNVLDAIKTGGTLDTVQKFLKESKPVYLYDYNARGWYISPSEKPASKINQMNFYKSITARNT
jgi:hypothetical protein